MATRAPSPEAEERGSLVDVTSPATLTLAAVIYDGHGLARGWMLRDLLYSDVLRVAVHPGTLNVHAAPIGAQLVPPNEPVSPAAHRARGFMLVRPCRVNGVDCFVVRQDGGDARMYLEIVGPHLIHDGAGCRVVIEVDPTGEPRTVMCPRRR